MTPTAKIIFALAVIAVGMAPGAIAGEDKPVNPALIDPSAGPEALPPLPPKKSKGNPAAPRPDAPNFTPVMPGAPSLNATGEAPALPPEQLKPIAHPNFPFLVPPAVVVVKTPPADPVLVKPPSTMSRTEIPEKAAPLPPAPPVDLSAAVLHIFNFGARANLADGNLPELPPDSISVVAAQSFPELKPPMIVVSPAPDKRPEVAAKPENPTPPVPPKNDTPPAALSVKTLRSLIQAPEEIGDISELFSDPAKVFAPSTVLSFPVVTVPIFATIPEPVPPAVAVQNKEPDAPPPTLQFQTLRALIQAPEEMSDTSVLFAAALSILSPTSLPVIPSVRVPEPQALPERTAPVVVIPPVVPAVVPDRVVAPPVALPPFTPVAIPHETLTALIQMPLIADTLKPMFANGPDALAPVAVAELPAVKIPELPAVVADNSAKPPTKLPEPGDAPRLGTLPVAPQIPEKVELQLKVISTIINVGEPAVVSLSGPDAFLNEAIAEYALSDELGRQFAHEGISLGGLKVEESDQPQTEEAARNKMRKLKIAVPIELALAADGNKSGAPLRLHLDMSVHGRDKRVIKLGAELSAARPVVSEVPVWDGWISFAANPPAVNAWDKLNKLGISGGMQYRLSAVRREALRAGNAPFFVENVSNKMLSKYHSERGLWQKTITQIAVNKNSTAPLAREPSISSTAFAEAYTVEIGRVAGAFANDPPLFFSLASEPSMTRLNLPVDFDFSPAALEEFRRWLERDTYGTLAALNEEWGTKFESWQAILPMTTNDARLRLRDGVGNFAPWVDFRDFQDYTFAKVLREGAEQIRTTIPNAKVGITGAMGPFAFGGWDWSRLASDLDVAECYDIGSARALWRDLAPGKPALASITVPALGAEKQSPERVELERALWMFALEGGSRGALVWDAPGTEISLLDPNGETSEAAKSLGPVLNPLKGEAGRILASGRRAHDGVAVLYSPASVRLTWLFEADRIPGENWLERWGGDSGAERRESPQLRLRESWGKLLDDLGVGWRFVSSREIERGLLGKPEGRIKTLILPRSISLSDREAEAIKQFAAAGGKVIADAVCGRFDEHGKLRAHGALDDLFGVNTNGEPVFARPMKPLERIKKLPDNEGSSRDWDLEFLSNLPPVFSDEPKWNVAEKDGQRRGAEYRMSPVMALGRNSAYLNLDLTDYLRWRLQPGSKRAAAARKALLEVGLAKNAADCAVDLDKSHLPAGTQVIRLSLGKSEQAGFVLALRRNPQARLRELGVEGETNEVFEKAESFTLVLREKKWQGGVYPSAPDNGQAEAVETLNGTLDPNTPTVFVLYSKEPAELSVDAPMESVKLEPVVVKVKPNGDAPSGALYSVKVRGPNDRERAHYGALISSKDGALNHAFTPALNDPSGTWKVSVRDLLSGASKTLTVELKDGE